MREKKLERVRAFLISSLVLLGFGVSPSFAIPTYTYPNNYVWDFGDQFSSSPGSQASDGHNIAWEYRGGNIDTTPSDLLSTGALTWDPNLNPGKGGTWYGATTSPGSWIGKGFMRACFDENATGDPSPYLIWVANVSGPVRATITVNGVDFGYSTRVYQPDNSFEDRSHNSGNANFNYSYLHDFTVKPGDILALRISSELPGDNPLVNVGFRVELLPEPTVLLVILLGGMGLIWRRRRGQVVL